MILSRVEYFKFCYSQSLAGKNIKILINIIMIICIGILNAKTCILLTEAMVVFLNMCHIL